MLGFDMPRWRFDLLHPVDLVEDLAIGHGYEDLGTDVPKAPMNALPRPDDHLRRRIRTSMQGMGFMQIQSLTLSNVGDQFDGCVGNRSMQLHVSQIQSQLSTP